MTAMRLRSWIVLGLLAACDERFPLELAPPNPPPFDAGATAEAAAIVPKGSRTLGVEVQIDALDFGSQVNAILDAGARTTNAQFLWTEIERPFDAGPDAAGDAAVGAEGGTNEIFNAGFHIVSLVLGTNRVRASLAVAALDGTGPRLPAGLEGKALDDDAVTTRYDVITDYVFSQIIDLELDAYLVAVDADAALGTDAAKWASFATFVSKVGAHVRTKRPNLKVGFTMSAAALSEKKDLVARALAASDVVVVTQPASFDALVDASPGGKPVFVHRIGLDAGDVFGQWDRYGDRIPIVTFPAVSSELVREARSRGF